MSFQNFTYNFPSNKRAEECGIIAQFRKVREEVAEVDDALEREEDLRVAEETLDTIHAAEGVLRKLPAETVEQAYQYVLEKNTARGDYEVGK